MKFGVREICDVVLKAKATQKVGNKIFYKNEPVIYFDTLKTSSLEGAATQVYATGGRGNARLVAWEGERTVTFIMEDALRTNVIPDQVANLYKVTPAIIEYQITDEIKQECIEYIDSTIEKWNALSNEDCFKQHRNFTRIQKNGKEVNDYYYCSCLCPHSKKCPHFRDFLDTMVKKEEEDLLS